MSDEELEAVMLHELLHVERRDNLAVFLQKGLTALLWFYPIAWLIDRRLFEERERACDEEVLRLRQSPVTYVSGILKVARACVEHRLVGTSSIGGASLKRRMKHLLSAEPPRRLGTPERALIIGWAAGLTLLSLSAGFVNRDAYAAWSSSTNRVSLRDLLPGRRDSRGFHGWRVGCSVCGRRNLGKCAGEVPDPRTSPPISIASTGFWITGLFRRTTLVGAGPGE